MLPLHGKHRTGYFNPRTPYGVRRHRKIFRPKKSCISIHAPLAGCDRHSCSAWVFIFAFQSTHPSRGATGLGRSKEKREPISIHAPLAGCDHRQCTCARGPVNFNPRTPRGVRRRCKDITTPSWLFQSTHPLRGATCGSFAASPPCLDFNPRTPLAGCDAGQRDAGLAHAISIHAPLAGCDIHCTYCSKSLSDFNPRTPCGVRPWSHCPGPGRGSNFNPRTPRGVRRQFPNGTLPTSASFQSTHPLRGATGTHARHGFLFLHFNPRTPRGVRPASDGVKKNGSQFQSTHPLWGATGRPCAALLALWNFNPRTPCGVRQP